MCSHWKAGNIQSAKYKHVIVCIHVDIALNILNVNSQVACTQIYEYLCTRKNTYTLSFILLFCVLFTQ